MNFYQMVDTFAYHLKAALDSAEAHGDIPHINFYTYKSIDPLTGQPPQLELPYVAIDIPAGGTASLHRRKPGVYRQPVIERTRVAVQVGGRLGVSLDGMETGGFDTDISPICTVVKDHIERNVTVVAPALAHPDFAGQYVSALFDQPSDQPFRVKDHEGHLFYVILEHVTATKEAI
jgi:hypothetical protein